MARILGSGSKLSPQTAFGETTVASLHPVAAVVGYYDIVGEQLEQHAVSGGTVGAILNEFYTALSTTSGSHATLRTKRALIYRAGIGGMGRFTARFAAPVTNSRQLAGLFNDTDGYRYGYDGAEFGILHERGGALEVRQLTLSGSASGVESLTVTVDDAAHTFNVASGTTAQNAATITDELNANVPGWEFAQNDGAVVALAHSQHIPPAPKTGVFSFINNSAGTCLAAWSTTHVGATVSETWIPQSTWNVDKVPWLIPQNGNVFQVQFQYLGYGGIIFSIEDPVSCQLEPVHKIKWANNYQTTSVGRPSFRIGWEAISLGSTTALTLRGASAALFTEGTNEIFTRTKGESNTKTGISTTATNVLTLRCRHTYGHHDNIGEMRLQDIEVNTDSGKGGIVDIYIDPVLNGTTDFAYVDEDESLAEYDTAATTYASGGTLIKSIAVGSVEGRHVDLTALNAFLLHGERLSIVCRVVSGAASAFTVTANWLEVK